MKQENGVKVKKLLQQICCQTTVGAEILQSLLSPEFQEMAVESRLRAYQVKDILITVGRSVETGQKEIRVLSLNNPDACIRLA